VLRQKGARLEKLTADLERLITDMLDTMRAAAGVGLAAQQVGRPLQLTVIDVRGIKDRPSTLEIAGETADPPTFMPMVLINPEIKPIGPPVAGPEGCLSFPEVYADITRPSVIDVTALNHEFKPITFRAGGLLSRAIQHEADHLNGILFIDRMSKESRLEVAEEIKEIQTATKEALKKA